MDLTAQLAAVVNEASFLAFVKALAADRRSDTSAERSANPSPYGPSAAGWENQTIEHFLEAAVAWAEATNMGKSQGLAESNPWKRFAIFLYCGKIYE